MRASIAAEAAGIPSVSVVCSGFERQAQATGRGAGFDELQLAVLDGHVDALDQATMVERFVTTTIDQVIDALTRPARSGDDGDDGGGDSADGDVGATALAEPAPLDTVMSGSIDELYRGFVAAGWSDGLPFIPPTRDRVEAFIAPSGRDPWKCLGIAKSSGRDISVWSIAVNAVMAGCAPEHLPVLIAIAEILADPHYGVEHSGNTTGADALIVVSGPSIASLGFNSQQGALRDGTHANTSIGRWLRLFLRNVCDFTTDEHDKATFGNTFRVVLAEDYETLVDIGWPTLAADFGLDAETNVAAMARMNSGAIIGSVFGSTPDEIVPYLGDGLMRVSGWDLTHVYGLGHGQFRPLLILSPILARVFARAGWSKDDVREALFEHARMPAWRFEKLIGEWSNLTAGRRSLHELATSGLVPAAFGTSDDPDRLVPIVTEPAKFMIAVAGDPNRTNAYAMSNDGPHGDWTAKPIDVSYSTDLVCEVPQ